MLVTRPETGAAHTAARLAGQGFEPVLLPLSRIFTRIVAFSPAQQQAVAVTSVNALRHASSQLIESLAHLPCYAVGARTAQAARQAGFAHVEEGQGNAATLAERIIAASPDRLAYLCGKVRFPGFEERLTASGIQVEVLETYDTMTVDYTDESIRERLDSQPVEAILLYSAHAAVTMQALLQRKSLQILFEKAQFFALSQRIAAVLGVEFSNRVNVAKYPSEACLLALLRNP